MTDFEKQIANLRRKLEQKVKDVNEAELKYVTACAAQVQTTAQMLMRDTEVNQSKAYGKKKHHPSVPGEAPAIDTGTLLRSVVHSVDAEVKKATGYVGTKLKYGAYLEFGTSKMRPRPWLSTALIKCSSFMAEARERILGGAIRG